MFEVDVTQLDEEAALAAAAQLHAIIDHAEARLLAVAAHYADLHPHPSSGPASGDLLPGMERAVAMGGDGCPSVAEFAAVELGAALGYSSGAAASMIEDALALRHRLPRVWARVQAGEVQAWRARQVAHATQTLSRAAAGFVDSRVARIVQSITLYRLNQIVEAAVMQADPDRAQAAADQAKSDRGVWVGQSDFHGTKTMVVKAAAGDVIRFDAATDQLAACLASLGDQDDLDARRGKAIGLLAQPQAALDVWSSATADIAEASLVPGVDTTVGASGGKRPAREQGLGGSVTLYVHLTDRTLATGTGVTRATATTCRTRRTRATSPGATGDEVRRRSEQLRPMLAAQLAELIGQPDAKIIVKPVIDLNQQVSVDAYEIPDRIREHVLLRYATCIFPWCNRPAAPGATGIDLDHVVPFDDTGPPGQTSTENLAPGCRLHHRVKTHGGWRCRRLADGAFEWTSPLGRRYRVDHTGTHPVN